MSRVASGLRKDSSNYEYNQHLTFLDFRNCNGPPLFTVGVVLYLVWATPLQFTAAHTNHFG
jgi:hypothetical protein